MQRHSQEVLDLDETLVSSYSVRSIPQHLLTSEQRHFVVRYSPSSGCMDEIAVFPRPGVAAFLKQLASFAEVVLYTAGNAGMPLLLWMLVMLLGLMNGMCWQPIPISPSRAMQNLHDS